MENTLGLVNDTEKASVYFNDLYGEVSQMQKDRYAKNFEWFKKSFGVENCYIASSSGRVEVCGNHTDHQGGKVVSCSISLDIISMFLPTNDGIIRIKSEGHADMVIDTNKDEQVKIGTSTAIVRGIVEGLKQRGYKVGGFIACCTSNVLNGAGISSSAAFECLIVKILSYLYNDNKVTTEDIAKISQFSENVYFGKPCGLLDQTAIAFGGIKELDFFDKEKIGVKAIENSLSDYTLILVDTGSDHANLTNEYAAIPAEMFAVAKALGKTRLSDVNEDDFYANLNSLRKTVSDRAVLRAIHYFNENKRVDKLANALNNNDYKTFLNCISESGKSSYTLLQNCYVAGGKDQSVPIALALSAKCLKDGDVNRIHGGGFAGTILNVVKNENVEEFINELSAFYKKESIIPLKVRKVGSIVL
ncbi:MAG: galactokinase [Clostridia bacterium]|nr:galactokinase [Clostridia bacterium]